MKKDVSMQVFGLLDMLNLTDRQIAIHANNSQVLTELLKQRSQIIEQVSKLESDKEE